MFGLLFGNTCRCGKTKTSQERMIEFHKENAMRAMKECHEKGIKFKGYFGKSDGSSDFRTEEKK